MDSSTYNKRTFFNILSWCIVAAYITLNVMAPALNLPLSTLMVALPVINLFLITAWFFVRTFYNNAHSKIKHAQQLALKPTERSVPTYGKNDNPDYEPHVTISALLFETISTIDGNKTTFDSSMRDYLLPGKTIFFHNELDYGVFKKVTVAQAKEYLEGIEVSFTDTKEQRST